MNRHSIDIALEIANEQRPRTFCWVLRNGVPFPQIIFDDPRVGCEGLAIIDDTELTIQADDPRTLDQLATDYPAPKMAVAS